MSDNTKEKIRCRECDATCFDRLLFCYDHAQKSAIAMVADTALAELRTANAKIQSMKDRISAFDLANLGWSMKEKK